MNNKILSIIIPAYNVEQYIERCLNSVTDNVKNIDDLDIVVINDGSTDRTLELSKRYALKYPDSVRVIDKSNGGWGTGINRGIEEAHGKYLKTLDSDDWFNTNNLDKFIDLLRKIDVDMVLTSYSEINASNIIMNKDMPETFCNRKIQIDDYLINNNYNLGAPIHAITYKTSILKDSKFKVADKYYGDLDYIITPLIHINTLYISSLNIYQYFIGRDGQSISVKGYISHIDDYLKVCEKGILFWINNNEVCSKPLYNLILRSTIERIRWAYILLMSPVYCGNKKESILKLKELDKLIKSNRTLYSLSNKEKFKKIIPWIYIWRKTGINLLKF